MAALVAPFLFTIGPYINQSMKNLLYCAAIAALLSSCNQTNQNENGRYIPVAIGDGLLKIVDTQTGRVYSRELFKPYNSESHVYEDYVEGATKMIQMGITNPNAPE